MIASSEDASELVIKGAERSDSGAYDLLLENKVGKQRAQIKVKVIGRPNAPEGPLLFEEIQANSVKVTWKAPTDDGGSEILGYIVERREATRNAWYTVESRVIDTQLVVKGLREGTEYHFKVTAENSFGVSSSLKSEQPLVPKTPLCKIFTLSAFLQLLLSCKCESVQCKKLICSYHFYHTDAQALQNLPALHQRLWTLPKALWLWLGPDPKTMEALLSLATLLSTKCYLLKHGLAMR